jgi:hypothetical protein
LHVKYTVSGRNYTVRYDSCEKIGKVCLGLSLV